MLFILNENNLNPPIQNKLIYFIILNSNNLYGDTKDLQLHTPWQTEKPMPKIRQIISIIWCLNYWIQASYNNINLVKHRVNPNMHCKISFQWMQRCLWLPPLQFSEMCLNHFINTNLFISQFEALDDNTYNIPHLSSRISFGNRMFLLGRNPY